jgi:hypothetical protein
MEGISGAERAPSDSSCKRATFLSPNLLFMANLKSNHYVITGLAPEIRLKISHLVDPLVSRGSELNLVVISVDVREFCLPNVGIVLWGTEL